MPTEGPLVDRFGRVHTDLRISVVLGLVFSEQVLTVFGLLPVWGLAGFLAYAGIRHAMLVLDLRRAPLAIAVVAGLVGI